MSDTVVKAHAPRCQDQRHETKDPKVYSDCRQVPGALKNKKPVDQSGMQSFHHFTEAKDSSNKIKAMTDLVNALKGVLDHYDIATRRVIWKRLTTAKGTS